MEKIPKIIHYCWFGKKEYPELVKKCIESWKLKMPEYKIIEWNEENFNINKNRYVKEAYENKKYAFVSDYARLDALVNYGGIYLDTDVEVVKSFNPLIQGNRAFLGFENKNYLGTNVMGGIKNHMLYEKFLQHYENIPFILDNGMMDLTPNVTVLTELCKKEYDIRFGGELQRVRDLTIYPQEYFSPIRNKEKKYIISNKTYSIHYFLGSWISEDVKKRGKNKIWKFFLRPLFSKIKPIIYKIFGRTSIKPLERKIHDFVYKDGKIK